MKLSWEAKGMILFAILFVAIIIAVIGSYSTQEVEMKKKQYLKRFWGGFVAMVFGIIMVSWSIYSVGSPGDFPALELAVFVLGLIIISFGTIVVITFAVEIAKPERPRRKRK